MIIEPNARVLCKYVAPILLSGGPFGEHIVYLQPSTSRYSNIFSDFDKNFTLSTYCNITMIVTSPCINYV